MILLKVSKSKNKNWRETMCSAVAPKKKKNTAKATQVSTSLHLFEFNCAQTKKKGRNIADVFRIYIFSIKKYPVSIYAQTLFLGILHFSISHPVKSSTVDLKVPMPGVRLQGGIFK